MLHPSRSLCSLVVLLTACGGEDGSAPPVDATAVADAVVLDASIESPPPDADTGPKLVFVTSVKYSGDLQTAGSGTDGLDGADRLCALHAAAGGLAGTYRAWLSTPAVSAIDRVLGDGPWLNLMGEMAFANRAMLQTTPTAAVLYDEEGQVQMAAVWTGTAVGGGLASPPTPGESSHCESWTTSDLQTHAVGGRSFSDDATWTNFDEVSCGYQWPLYCFGQ